MRALFLSSSVTELRSPSKRILSLQSIFFRCSVAAATAALCGTRSLAALPLVLLCSFLLGIFQVEFESLVVHHNLGVELVRKRRLLRPARVDALNAKDIDCAIIHEAIEPHRVYFFLALLPHPSCGRRQAIVPFQARALIHRMYFNHHKAKYLQVRALTMPLFVSSRCRSPSHPCETFDTPSTQ
jgi:hypothetical protein